MLRKKGTASGGMLLTPLIDVLFLVVFFLVLGADFQPLEGIHPPQGSTGTAPPHKALLVLLHANGRVSVPRFGFATPQGSLATSPDSTQRVVTHLQQHHPSAILLTPDQNVTAKTLLYWHQTLQKRLQLPIWIGLAGAATPQF